LEEYVEQSVRNDEDSFVNSYVKSVGPDYDKEQLNFLLRDLLGAGSETTMTTILWALIYLANHQEWQTRMKAQVRLIMQCYHLQLGHILSRLSRIASLPSGKD
jgi:cytochrome P450